MRKNFLAVAASSVLTCAIFLSGCSTSFAPGPEAPVQTEFGPVGGTVHGGQQPIAAGHIYAYQTSTSAYGGASKSLIAATGGVSGYTPLADGNGDHYVLTDASGQFEIASTTTCTSGTVVYLYSISGQPTAGVTNTAAGEMAVLGVCPANGLLIDSISATGAVHINMNEVSTVAAAYALAGFATDATDIGAPTTTGGVITDTLAQTGIQNAAANAAQLYTAVASGPGDPGANATTANGNGTVPQKLINSLANIIAACINSGGENSPVCLNERSNVSSDGTSTGTRPADTATGMIYIAHNPTVNVTTLFNDAGSSAPFSPSLTVAPSNFTIAISFTGGGMAPSIGGGPHDVAVDGLGNVYAATGADTIAKFSPLGVPASSTGFTGNGLNEPTSVSIDSTSSYVWAANFASSQVSEFTTGGTAVAAYSPGGSGMQDIQFNNNGRLWITASTGQLDKMKPNGDVVKTATGNGLDFPDAIAVTTDNDIWVPNTAAAQISVFKNSDKPLAGSPFTNDAGVGYGVAIDASGHIWTTRIDGSISEFASNGSSVAGSPYATGVTGGNGTTPNADGIAIDGAGHVWVTSSYGKAIYEFNNSGTLLSGTGGFPVSPAAQPDGIALDGSGDVWYGDDNDSNLHEIIGAATPVVAPLAYAVANSMYGTRP